MFDYLQLEALLEIERAGSIDGAARSLGISSSAVSQRIKVLEERVGAVTLSRQNPAVPTDFGRLLCRHAEKVIFMEQELISKNEGQFADMKKGAHTVKVAVDQTAASTWFIDVLRSAMTCNGSILYDITIVENNLAIEMMKRGDALAAVSNRKQPIQGYKSKSIGLQVYKAVMTPAFAQTHFPDGVDAQTIQSCATIKRSAHDDLYRDWISHAFGFELELSAHIIPAAQGIQAAVLQNVGWAILPAETANPLLDTGQLIELIDGQDLQRPIYWHFCRAITDALQPLTRSVQQVAAIKLVQPPLPKLHGTVNKPLR